MMIEKLHWLGHSSFRIQGDVVIYIDPWKIASRALSADIVLVTHSHYDHLSREDIDRVKASHTEILIPQTCHSTFGEDVKTISPGETTTIKGIKIEAVPAYNIESGFHPEVNEWVGYVIHLPEGIIYHGGDTDFIPEMNSLNVDIALLPIGGIFTMTAEQAVEAAVAVNAKIAVPIHWGDVSGNRASAERFVELAKAKGIDGRIMDQER